MCVWICFESVNVIAEVIYFFDILCEYACELKFILMTVNCEWWVLILCASYGGKERVCVRVYTKKQTSCTLHDKLSTLLPV